MSDNRFSRRYFFYGTLLAGAVPRGGFGSTPSLKALGYKSPNEKVNLAGVGANAGSELVNDCLFTPGPATDPWYLQTEIRRDLHSRFREMFLAVTLLE
jgi:hypothetical protein